MQVFLRIVKIILFPVKKLFSYMASLKLTAVLLSIIVAAVFVKTIILEDNLDISFFNSWWLSLVLITLIHNLAIFTVKRAKRIRKDNLGFLVMSVGFVFLVLSLVLGIKWYTNGRLRATLGKTSCTYRTPDNKGYSLPFAVTLEDFQLQYNDFGNVVVQSPDLPIPLKFPALPGKQYPLDQYDSTLEIVEYIPDFQMTMPDKLISSKSPQPNNPALHINIKGYNKCDTWLFAKYPEMWEQHENKIRLPFRLYFEWSDDSSKHLSTILVTDNGAQTRAQVDMKNPFFYKGYYLYLVDYDQAKHQYVIFKVVMYPAIYVTYASLVLIAAGGLLYLLTILFYKRQPASPEAIHESDPSNGQAESNQE